MNTTFNPVKDLSAEAEEDLADKDKQGAIIRWLVVVLLCHRILTELPWQR